MPARLKPQFLMPLPLPLLLLLLLLLLAPFLHSSVKQGGGGSPLGLSTRRHSHTNINCWKVWREHNCNIPCRPKAMHTACVPFCRGNPSHKVCTVCVCVCLGLARMMLEGKRFFRPSLVVAVVVVGLPGHQSCLPACQPSCQTCLFQAFNYVCLGPGPDTHTRIHTLVHP